MITLLIVLWVVAGVLAAWLISKFVMTEYEAITVLTLIVFILFGGIGLFFVTVAVIDVSGILHKSVFKGKAK